MQKFQDTSSKTVNLRIPAIIYKKKNSSLFFLMDGGR